MSITPRATYRIKSGIPYFESKYGSGPHEITIEDTDTAVFEKPWHAMNGNPAALQFAWRSGEALRFDLSTPVWYGKVHGLGELVWEDELEEL